MSTGSTTLLVLLLMPSDARGLWTKPNVAACYEEWLGMQRGWWLQGLLITSQVNMLAGTFWPFFVMGFEDTKTEHLIALTAFLSWSFLSENPICNGTLSAITVTNPNGRSMTTRMGQSFNGSTYVQHPYPELVFEPCSERPHLKLCGWGLGDDGKA